MFVVVGVAQLDSISEATQIMGDAGVLDTLIPFEQETTQLNYLADLDAEAER